MVWGGHDTVPEAYIVYVGCHRSYHPNRGCYTRRWQDGYASMTRF